MTKGFVFYRICNGSISHSTVRHVLILAYSNTHHAAMTRGFRKHATNNPACSPASELSDDKAWAECCTK